MCSQSAPGITVRDPQGREWHVKQPPHNEQGAEGPIEVVVSRVLSAVGYHQPPVYFLPSLRVKDAEGTHVEPGGRFRLTAKSIKAVDSWSWQQNPFVGMRPYQGLLVILAMFSSSDIKNENNTLYDVKAPGDGPKHWYVVRDLGTALGKTGRLAPCAETPTSSSVSRSSSTCATAWFGSTTAAGTRSSSVRSRRAISRLRPTCWGS